MTSIHAINNSIRLKRKMTPPQVGDIIRFMCADNSYVLMKDGEVFEILLLNCGSTFDYRMEPELDIHPIFLHTLRLLFESNQKMRYRKIKSDINHTDILITAI